MNGEFFVRAANGDIYTITYKSGKYDGEIVVKFANGDKFEGQVDDSGYKKGAYTFADGTCYDGTWKGGRPEKVKVTDANGKRVKSVSVYRATRMLNIDLLNVR
jgi:hypothetical protein